MAERRFNPLDPLGLFSNKGGSLNDQIAKLRNNPAASPGNKIEVKRYQGQIVQVGSIRTKTLMLPDWSLSYVEFPPGEKNAYREAFAGQGVSVRKVTNQRIYFEQ